MDERSGSETTADREIVIARGIDGPRDRVFDAFTAVDHLSHWWGPDGFTTTTHTFEFRPGGVWDFTMHGSDGNRLPEPHRMDRDRSARAASVPPRTSRPGGRPSPSAWTRLTFTPGWP